jgi:hypothetical protein
MKQYLALEIECEEKTCDWNCRFHKDDPGIKDMGVKNRVLCTAFNIELLDANKLHQPRCAQCRDYARNEGITYGQEAK